VSRLKTLDWHIEEDSFTDDTPYGVKRFTNVIATKDPTATRRLILAAHHDSKFFPSFPQNQVRNSHLMRLRVNLLVSL
jgi:glutaminyl-peptide cyclotransferase